MISRARLEWDSASSNLPWIQQGSEVVTPEGGNASYRTRLCHLLRTSAIGKLSGRRRVMGLAEAMTQTGGKSRVHLHCE